MIAFWIEVDRDAPRVHGITGPTAHGADVQTAAEQVHAHLLAGGCTIGLRDLLKASLSAVVRLLVDRERTDDLGFIPGNPHGKRQRKQDLVLTDVAVESRNF